MNFIKRIYLRNLYIDLKIENMITHSRKAFKSEFFLSKHKIYSYMIKNIYPLELIF